MATSTKSQTSDIDDSGYVVLTSEQARQEVLFALARRFKGTDQEVDKRLDAAAARIVGSDIASMVPGERKGAPRVPLYFEGEPGVGKTTLIRAATREFCKIAGLNFVENPPDDYQFGDNDLYFFTVNLSGKLNTADLGGMPFRQKMGAKPDTDALERVSSLGKAALDGFSGRAQTLAAFVGEQKLRVVNAKRYENGPLETVEVEFVGDMKYAERAADTLERQVDAELKAAGIGLSRAGGDSDHLRVTSRVQPTESGVRVALTAPKAALSRSEQMVMSQTPNIRFAQAAGRKWCVVNFDDVANAHASVRNALLEVTQSNRYSGVMDLGNAFVALTGNMGAQDNTNVQSPPSDAEVTRVAKYRVKDTPADWAKRVMTATTNSAAADCHFASFVNFQGNTEGIFRPTKDRERGKPKPNSRSLENALSQVEPFFLMARESGVPATVFRNRIERAVAATCGARVADAYLAHVAAMESEALPLAEACIANGEFKASQRTTLDRGVGKGMTTSETDFQFRFAAALADAAVNALATGSSGGTPVKGLKAEATMPERVEKIIGHMTLGLGVLKPAQLSYAISRLAMRLAHRENFGAENDQIDGGFAVRQDIAEAMGRGIAIGVQKGYWGAEEFHKPGGVLDTFSVIVTGSTRARRASGAMPGA